MEIKYISPIGELIYPHINREDLDPMVVTKRISSSVLTKPKEFIEYRHNLAKDEFLHN